MVKRKNNSEWRGHYSAVGRSANPDLDLVHQLCIWLSALGIERHPLCASRATVQHHTCNPVFSRRAIGPVSMYVAISSPMWFAVRRMAALC